MSTDATNGSQPTEDRTDAPDNTEAPATDDDPPPNDEHTEETADGPPDRIEELESKVEALQEERDELNERLLRKAAEFDNYRRRMEREKARRYKKGKLDVIEPLLEVVDDFERSMEAAEDLDEAPDAETAYESLKGGVEMVFRKFQDTLETLGVKPIEAEGHPFDENLHEAMMRQPTNDAEPGTVLHEIRKGYRMDDHIVRYSRVVVAAEQNDD
ncbi:MAG: nucleotide exchange factor GrpE [Salinibacter sp.]